MVDYNNYTDLITLAIGFNIIYVVIKNESKNALFYLFLDHINFNKSYEYIENKMAFFSAKLGAIKFLENSSIKDFQEIFKGKISLDKFNGLTERNKQIEILDDKHKKIKDRLKQNQNLKLITLMLSIYGFYIALSIPYSIENLNESLVVSNSVILIFVILYLIDDIFCWNIRKILCVSCILSLILTVFITRKSLQAGAFNHDILYQNYWITVVVCYSGFIFYITVSILSALISCYFCCNIWLRSLWFEKDTNKIEQAVRVHKDEFDNKINKNIQEIFDQIKQNYTYPPF